jgi:hypothetical protein
MFQHIHKDMLHLLLKLELPKLIANEDRLGSNFPRCLTLEICVNPRHK